MRYVTRLCRTQLIRRAEVSAIHDRRVGIPSRVTRAPRSPRASRSPLRSPAKRKACSAGYLRGETLIFKAQIIHFCLVVIYNVLTVRCTLLIKAMWPCHVDGEDQFNNWSILPFRKKHCLYHDVIPVQPMRTCLGTFCNLCYHGICSRRFEYYNSAGKCTDLLGCYLESNTKPKESIQLLGA